MFKDVRAGLERLARMALFAALAAAALGVHAKGILDDDDDDEDNKQPLEWAVTLPAFPRPENLLPFTTGPTATFEFAVDSRSLEVNAGEVRYTVIATSKAGVRNISYEGLRCSSHELKRYAVGHEGKWMPARSNKWMPVSTSINMPQRTLLRDYFCMGTSPAGTADQMVERIRYNRTLQELKYTGG